ncbi:Kinesin-like protein KIN12B [Abeliophyllum distichum]|uniref:Kinesin-like protein KIN12B n=1 Tax=Abeliophyllum distichum TaxID=126358 RepID=A0ABD1Q573_9LAMI
MATIVQKISNKSLSTAGQTFTFDSIADIESTQIDIFQLIGAPLVENCLAGFNSSVFAYGQTGSGKTYTIWGASNASLEECDQQGLTPRVCQRLFERINEEQERHADKQLVYMCRCSFLEKLGAHSIMDWGSIIRSSSRWWRIILEMLVMRWII